MKKITNEMYDTRFPNGNYEYFKNLDDKESYLDDYSLYNDLLTKYLIKNTSIKKFDDDIKNYKEFVFDYEPVPENGQDLYQYLCNDKLSFFYVRNNMYIERLNNEELNKLHSFKEISEYNDEVNSFIESTFRKVIREESEREMGTFYVNFGPTTKRDFFALNNSLVIGARFYEYVSALDTNEQIDAYYKRMDYFEDKYKELESILDDELNSYVKVIEYSEVSIKELPETEEKSLK